MTERERMVNAKLYCCDDELAQLNKRCRELMQKFNQTRYGQGGDRMKYIRELFAHVGEKAYIEPEVYFDYGCHISVGDNFYANTGLIILDQCSVTIGDNVFFGPRVNIYCAGHPIDAGVRNKNLEYGKPVTIGNDVWVGGNVVFNPGVTVGDDVVIGSGSVVTKDIPSHVIAAGNPCRVIRKITDEDRVYWESQEAEYMKSKANHY
ncbi:MAG: sugar O-acetyltransferase [Bacteroides sp.]|nr:sugar O-acetyltransferase [Bacteroides sp.]